jgi:hypothetical protein
MEHDYSENVELFIHPVLPGSHIHLDGAVANVIYALVSKPRLEAAEQQGWRRSGVTSDHYNDELVVIERDDEPRLIASRFARWQ